MSNKVYLLKLSGKSMRVTSSSTPMHGRTSKPPSLRSDRLDKIAPSTISSSVANYWKEKKSQESCLESSTLLSTKLQQLKIRPTKLHLAPFRLPSFWTMRPRRYQRQLNTKRIASYHTAQSIGVRGWSAGFNNRNKTERDSTGLENGQYSSTKTCASIYS